MQDKARPTRMNRCWDMLHECDGLVSPDQNKRWPALDLGTHTWESDNNLRWEHNCLADSTKAGTLWKFRCVSSCAGSTSKWLLILAEATMADSFGRGRR